MFAGDSTWTELDDAEHNEAAFAQMKPVVEVHAAHPWLGVCEQIAEKEGFFHWELDFAPVFAQRGGFDLQVGNPPWVRPDWDDNLVLAEDDAWFGLADKPAVAVVRERRKDVLDDGDERYLDERASVAGTSAHLGIERRPTAPSPVRSPTSTAVSWTAPGEVRTPTGSSGSFTLRRISLKLERMGCGGRPMRVCGGIGSSGIHLACLRSVVLVASACRSMGSLVSHSL